MGWDFDSKDGSSGTKVEFTKFPVGITKIRVIDEEPYVRWVHWLPQWKRSVNCPGKGCAICEVRAQQKLNSQPYTYQVGKRLAMGIINRETGKVEVMEQGTGFYQDLRDIMMDLRGEGKKLIDVDLKVRRRGTGKDDTTYRIDLDVESPLNNTDVELIKGKVDLAEYLKPHTFDQILRLVQGESWDDVMKREDTTSEAKDEAIEIS